MLAKGAPGENIDMFYNYPRHVVKYVFLRNGVNLRPGELTLQVGKHERLKYPFCKMGTVWRSNNIHKWDMYQQLEKRTKMNLLMDFEQNKQPFALISKYCRSRSTVCSGTDQSKYQSSASLAFVRGIHRCPMNFSHKGTATQNMFPFDDVIMVTPSNISWDQSLLQNDTKQLTKIMLLYRQYNLDEQVSL